MTHDMVQLQNRLHEALEAFLYGSILRPARWLPGRRLDELHPYWEQKLKDIEEIIWKVASTQITWSKQGGYRQAACILSTGYRVLSRLIDESPVDRENQLITPGKALATCGEGAQEQVFLEELRRYWVTRCGAKIQALFVHGSYATGDANRYSDLDVLVIVKKYVVVDENELYRFGQSAIGSFRYLLAADLLQHHGYFVLTDIDLGYYCDTYFPRNLFDFAAALYVAEPLSVRHVRDSRTEAYVHLKKMCVRFTKTWDRRALNLAYYLKLQLSSFMILPALLMQVLGKPWRSRCLHRPYGR